jgi:hypothetical protein
MESIPKNADTWTHIQRCARESRMGGLRKSVSLGKRGFDNAHNETVRHRDEEVRNRDMTINNTWSTFAEKWLSMICKLTMVTEKSSGKTHRNVEIESPYPGKRVIGPTKEPEPHHLVSESRGGFRALARQAERFLPRGYTGGASWGFRPSTVTKPSKHR